MTTPDPARLVQLLTDAGWTNAGGPEGRYTRMSLHGRVMLVPHDPAMADYRDMLDDVLDELKADADKGRRAQQVLDGLGDTGTVAPRG